MIRGRVTPLLLLVVLVLGTVGTAGGAVGQSGHENPKKLLVTVDGEPVVVADVLRRVAATRGRGIDPSSLPPDQWRRMVEDALEEEVRDRLLLVAARAQGMEVSPGEVEEALLRSREMMGKEPFARMLEGAAATEEDYRRFLERQLLIGRYRGRLTSDIEVTEEEAREYYEGHREGKSGIASFEEAKEEARALLLRKRRQAVVDRWYEDARRGAKIEYRR